MKRVLEVSSEMWLKMMDCFQDVKKAEESGVPFQCKLNDRYTLMSNIWPTEKGGNGKWYTGIQVLDAQGKVIPEEGMNLTSAEWASLECNSAHLNQLMHGDQNHTPQRGLKRPLSEGEEVVMYSWVLQPKSSAGPEVLAKKEQVPVCEDWYFTERDARKAGRQLLMDDVANLSGFDVWVIQEYRPPPSPLLLVKLCTLYLLYTFITVYSRLYCKVCTKRKGEGVKGGEKKCTNKGGCKDTYTQFEARVGKALESVTPQDLKTLVGKVGKAIGMNTPGLALLCEAVLVWIPNTCWLWLLKQGMDEIYGEKKYSPLKILIARVLEELEMDCEFEGRLRLGEIYQVMGAPSDKPLSVALLETSPAGKEVETPPVEKEVEVPQSQPQAMNLEE